MELHNFANAVAGFKTLAELEGRHPELAAGLEKLVDEVVEVCDRAYGRFAETLGQVVALEDAAPNRRRDSVQKRLREAYSHDWFKQVAKICARLHAVDDAFSARLQQIAVAQGVSDSDRRSLDGLIHLLNKHEHDIEDDIKFAAGEVGRLIAEAAATRNAGTARAKAQDVLNEISANMKVLLDLRVRLLGSAKRGTNGIVLNDERFRRAPAIHFVIITALEEELQAVLARLNNCKRLPPTKEDVRVYYQCRIQTRLPDRSHGTYSVIILSLLNMGRIEAATATGDAIRRWHPQYVLLVGIAGGIADAEVSLGDVIVSDQIVDYELQKVTPKGPTVRYSVHRADPRLLAGVQAIRPTNLRNRIRTPRPQPGVPKRIIGPIATGDKVIAVSKMLSRYRHDWPKLIGVEMEAGGVAPAAFQSAEQPGFLMIRGVSDLADEHKDAADVKSWRVYAAEAAAAYTVTLLKSAPIPL